MERVLSGSTSLDPHEVLCNDLVNLLKKYGFYVEKNIELPSKLFPFTVFPNRGEIDLYCHAKPFSKKAANGNEAVEVYASDWIIECKTGINLNENDKKKILEKAEYFPVYVAFPSDVVHELHDSDLTFLHENKVGVISFDKKSKTLSILSSAYSKMFVEESYGKRVVFTTPHKIFEIFTSTRNDDVLCLPQQIGLIGTLPNQSQKHDVELPKNLKELIGIRTKALKVFEKEGYETSEAWSLFSGQTDHHTFHGFSFPSLVYAFEEIYSNYQSIKLKQKPVTKIKFNVPPCSDLMSDWHNDDFVYCICASKGWESILLFVGGNAKYYSVDNYHLSFHEASFFCASVFGSPLQIDLGIKLYHGIDMIKEKINVRSKLIRNALLEPVQALTKTFSPNHLGPQSDNPAYYFYADDNSRFLIDIYESANLNFWKKIDCWIEPRKKTYRDFSYGSISLQSPLNYQNSDRKPSS